MKKLLLSVLSYFMFVTLSFGQEDSVSILFKKYLKKTIASNFDNYQALQTIYYDSAKVKEVFSIDTSYLNKMQLFTKMFNSRKFLAMSNLITAKIQKRINKNLVDGKILKFYDTTNVNYTNINLVDSSVKYNQDIVDNESYTFKIMHIFNFKNRDNMTITDSAMFLYTPKLIRMVSNSTSYKKGFNYLGTTIFNKDIVKEEREIFLEKRRKNKSQ